MRVQPPGRVVCVNTQAHRAEARAGVPAVQAGVCTGVWTQTRMF